MNSLNNEQFNRNRNKELVRTYLPKMQLQQPKQSNALKETLQSYYQFHLKKSKQS